MLIAGIDEAGRGPVIGPMVISCVVLTAEEEEMLKKIGVKDSKLLTPGKRQELFKSIKTIAKKYKIIVISPKEIDAAIESDNLNLNWLEAIKSAELINSLKPDVVYIDCPSTNIPNYVAYIKKLVKTSTKIVAEHKADTKYVSVGAASILSKVTRDDSIKDIQKRISVDIGSGYPSDPVTKIFLQKNHARHPEIFRHSWASYRELASSSKQSQLKDF